MRDQREEQDRWHREDEERRRHSEGRMRYDYGHQGEHRGGRQEERGSYREEGHSRWQGGGWQGEYPGREEQSRGGLSERGEYRGSSRGESRDEYGRREDRGSERWSEQGSGWSGLSDRRGEYRSEQSSGWRSPSDHGSSELRGGRQEQGRWGIGSEQSGQGRMSWEDRGDRHRSSDSGEYRGSDHHRHEELGRLDVGDHRNLEGGTRSSSPSYQGQWGREEYESDRDRHERLSRENRRRDSSGRSDSSGRDISGTWRQFDSWGDTEYGDSRGQGYGHHRRDSYSSDLFSQGERGRDHDR